jgi:glycosyltransferase involved in cell wall biosynthesis
MGITHSSCGQNMKILLIGYRDCRSAGGSLRVLETLAKCLPNEGVMVEVLFAYGQAGGVSSHLSCPIHYVHATGPTEPSAWLRVRTKIKEIKPDIIQFVDNVMWIMLALQGTAPKRIAYIHGQLGKERKLSRSYGLSRLMCTLADGAIAISPSAKASSVDAGIIQPEKTVIVSNAVDPRFYNITSEQVDANLETLRRPKQVRIGIACILTPNKGIYDAVRLMAYLPEDWTLTILGDGPYRDDLIALIEKEGVAHRITVTGYVEKIEEWYPRLDLYVFLSRYESFGLAMAEAMSYGIPVVGFMNYGEYMEGQPPLIDKDVAMLLPRDDPSQGFLPLTDKELSFLALEMQELWANASRLSRIKVAARDRIRSAYTGESQAKAILKAYEKIADCK